MEKRVFLAKGDNGFRWWRKGMGGLSLLLLGVISVWAQGEPASVPDSVESSKPRVASGSDRELQTELVPMDEPIPDEMIRVVEPLLGPDGTLEFDPEQRIVVVQDRPEHVDRAVSFLHELNDTYREARRKMELEEETASNEWIHEAKYFGKLQPGQSVRIEAVLLEVKRGDPESPSSRDPRSTTSEPISKRAVLEDLLLRSDEKKKAILREEGPSSPHLAEVKERIGLLLALIEEEESEKKREQEELKNRLIRVRDDYHGRLIQAGLSSDENAAIRQGIVDVDRLLDRADSEPLEEWKRRVLPFLERANRDSSADSSDVQASEHDSVDLSLPREVRRLGVRPEDLQIFSGSRIETLGRTTLRGTVFGKDSNGIAFTTISDYSLEFRLGHSTLGVTVALVPKRSVRDLDRGIQGMVARLNKVLMDTEVALDLDRPLIVGSYTHPDGSEQVLVVRIRE